MKILKLLNKKFFLSFIICLFSSFISFAENQPVDIWNNESKENNNTSNKNESEDLSIDESPSKFKIFDIRISLINLNYYIE